MIKVAIIGGGPGGYVTAIRLQQYGIEAVVFEKERLGGVCLNHGCIPTKSLVKVADFFSEMKESESFGISLDNLKLDFQKVYERKNAVVEKLISGIEFIFKKRQIKTIRENVIEIIKKGNSYNIITQNSVYFAEYIIVATGSIPKELPFMKFDGKSILSSRDVLKLEKLPQHLVVVGGGVIGCEFASIFQQFGVNVEIVEFLPKLIFNEDDEISKRLAMSLKKNKIKLHLKTAVESFEKSAETIKLQLSNGKEIVTNQVLVSVGRFAQFPKIAIETENDFIKISDEFRTNLPNVFAIGDVTGKLMLAHTASKQGLILADILHNEINQKNIEILNLNYQKIPACIFTNPEIGSIGKRESEFEKDETLVGKFPFSANGKALGLGNTFGFVKVIASKKTHQLLGVHIIGPHATELIAQCSVLLGLNVMIDDVKKVIFAHPTLSEVVMEAIEDLENLAIHKV